MLRCILIFTSLLLLYGTSALPTPKPFPPASCQINSNVPIPHPTLCGAYYVCLYGVYRLRFCEAGKIFNETHCVKGSCPVWCPQENAAVPHPDYCSVYYQCHKWTASLLPCYEGGFDPIRRNCSLDYPCHDGLFNLKSNPGIRKHSHSKESSSSSSSSSEESKDDEIFQCPSKNGNYPDPYFCNMYFECKKQKAKFHICRRGEAFDSKSGHCKRHGSGICGPKPVLEPSCDRRKDVFFHPEYCSVYIQCDKNKLDVKRCKKGEGFNPYEKKCDKKYNCKKDDGEATTDQGTTSSPPTTINSLNFKCPSYTVLLPHPKYCGMYYECRDGRDKDLRRCANGDKFNSDLQRCERHSSCVENERPGFNCPVETGVYPHSKCNLYYKCNYGLPQLRKCPRRQAYDAASRACKKGKKCLNGVWHTTTVSSSEPTITQSITRNETSRKPSVTTVTPTISKENTFETTVTQSTISEDISKSSSETIVSQPTISEDNTIKSSSGSTLTQPIITDESTIASSISTIAEQTKSTLKSSILESTLSRADQTVSTFSSEPTFLIELFNISINPYQITINESTIYNKPPNETKVTSHPFGSTISNSDSNEGISSLEIFPSRTPHISTSTRSPLVIEAENFSCATEYGYFVHPMSIKHFIHCQQFVPSLMKCSNNREFESGNELGKGKCIEPKNKTMLSFNLY